MKQLVIEIDDEVYKTVQDGTYCGSLYEELKAAIPYNPTGDTISREAINSEIEKRYCDKHCVVPSEEPYCPDICPARFLKNIVKECPAVPERPKGDLISREALKEECANVVKGSNNSDFIVPPTWNKAMELIDKAPTVDLWQMRQEATENALKKAEVLYGRPQGKWIPQGGGFSWVFKCSCCGWVDGYPLNERHKYCPNCGADMRGGADNEETDK